MHLSPSDAKERAIVSRKTRTWTHWDLNPGPSACEADVIPLHHVPVASSAFETIESVMVKSFTITKIRYDDEGVKLKNMNY